MNAQYEQVAFRSHNLRQHASDLTKRCGASPWIFDLVDAVHLFVADPAVGDAFQVELAFNYTLLPNTEVELIQLRQGRTVQLDVLADEPADRVMGPQTLSHLGYHLADIDGEDEQVDQLVQEMQGWIRNGYHVVQLSQTVVHSGTRRRYRYAFVDSRPILGTYTKIIQRLSYQSTDVTIANGREAFKWLADQL